MCSGVLGMRVWPCICERDLWAQIVSFTFTDWGQQQQKSYSSRSPLFFWLQVVNVSKYPALSLSLHQPNLLMRLSIQMAETDSGAIC